MKSHTNDLVGEILLRTLGLGRQQRCHGLASERSTDLSGTCVPKLLQDSRLLLAESPGVEVDSPVVAFKPLIPGNDSLELIARKQEERKGDKGLGQHCESGVVKNVEDGMITLSREKETPGLIESSNLECLKGRKTTPFEQDGVLKSVEE